MESISDSFGRSTVMPNFSASSDIFSNINAGKLSCLICNAILSWRSICEVLIITSTRSTGLFSRKCRTTCSSSENPCRSYIPGKSTSSTMSAPSSTLAPIRSTVIPGQLPTRADAPVMRLKKVDLPVFGMPNRAMRFITKRRERRFYLRQYGAT